MSDRDKKYFYDTIATDFDRIMNPYDVGRRLEIVFDELFAPGELNGKRVLDVGAGTGKFTERAVRAGAHVTATDIGSNLLRQIRNKTRSQLCAADACSLGIASGSFDAVISSECIEHTPDPLRAVREMCRVLKRPGVLVLTTPNRVWHFSARLADTFRLRPYQGLENWVGWSDLTQTVQSEGLTLTAIRGFHLVPPLFRPLWAPLRAIDDHGRFLGRLMLNVALRAERR